MRPVSWWVLTFAAWSLLSLPARAEPPTPARGHADAATVASLAEEREFEAETRRYQKLAEITARLVSEREQREFEAATERYLRFAGLTRRLAEKASRELEQSFQAEVDLYLKKRELTSDLAERSAATSMAAPAPASAPRW